MFRFPCSLLTPALIAATTCMVLAFVLSPSLGGYGADDFFSYHGVFMVTAFLLLLPLGVLSYSIDLGATGNAAYPDRDSRRVLHGVANLFGVLVALCGYLVAFVYHAVKGKAHLAFGESPARQAHVWLGLAALAGCCLAAAAGLYRFVAADRDGRRLFRWHGVLGPLSWLCGLLAICLAAFFDAPEGDGAHWAAGQRAAVVAGTAAVAAVLGLHARLGVRDHLAPSADDDDYEADGGEASGVKRGGLLQ